MAAHTIRRGGIKTVVSKESPGRICGENLSVKEHTHQIGVPGAEFHIMGNHDDGDTPGFQAGQNLGKG